MRSFLLRFFAVIGVLSVVLTTMAFFIVIVVALSLSSGRVPSKAVLEANFETGLIEHAPDDAIAKLMTSGAPSVRDVVDALERASNDKRVAGLVARVGAGEMGAAQVQEVRDAILKFRAKKKFAIAWGETIGEFAPASGGYHLATAFDEIWLQPSGDVGLTGIAMESMFLRGTFDKFGVVPRMDHRYEYKNAKNMFTEKKFTPAHREASERLMQSIWDQRIRAIAQGRNMTPEQVRALVDRGPFLGQEARDAGLVDSLGYRDEAYKRAMDRAGKDAQLLNLAKYLEIAGRPHQSGKTVALIYGVGTVMRGKSGFDPMFGSATMGSDTVAGAFRDAIEDSSVKAIIFRVDSPGGSYVASDTIWHETLRAKRAGKPVIVSMGDVAASGGYLVSMHADKIIAQPGTITGSIGVLGGKMLTKGLYDKVGVTFDSVHEGKNAMIWSSLQDYTPSGWERFQASLDRIYADFTQKVAQGRRLPRDKVLQIAKGRVWTGEDAKTLGLVDELGGFPAAIAEAKHAAKIPASEDINLRVFPAGKTLLQAIMDRLAGEQPESSSASAAEAALVRALKAIQPLARELRVRGVVEMPETQIR